ncbi:F-box domain, Leucine-rich repeat domain, L domain-like protein [Artemisia annua]|uniref:F-box domain, Leucine-rich repeat domain, L domain-like protein n=1 Tax=Artemisia annua TaxID=35608 RepID=A0A2U1ML63_ARTAN|nr:F-box domain, Leucine-rich repeat domain, L domain-like protein [Artemisia annua]
MKKSKRPKPSNIENEVDRISDLPDPILHLILSAVRSTEEVVRTSVLSTRWKYLWTSIPSLDIDIYRRSALKTNEFKEFVYWDIDEIIELPRCLVDCDSLEVLNLCLNHAYLSVSSFTGSRTLKVLKLDRVGLFDSELEKFLANCPLLEELSLIDCLAYAYLSISPPNLKTLRINNRGLSEKERYCEGLMVVCPKLVYLEYGGYMGNEFSFNAKSLKKAVIELEYTEYKDEIAICQLFSEVSHVEYLSGNYIFIQKSKRPKPSNIENEVDRISNLPDPILHLILSPLRSTEEVVRTSVLSTRWKYLWTSIPSLDIDIYRRSALKTNEFKEFVYWVLANRTQDLDSFRLSCSNHYDMPTIGRWIHLVVMRKIKQLDLTFCFEDIDEIIELPRCLVDCDSLEVLNLCLSHAYLSVSSFTGSRTLKVLKLDRVGLFDSELEKFLANCPLLEELSLIDCLAYAYLSISPPNLKTLRINNRGLSEKERYCEGLMVVCPKLVYLEYGGYMGNEFSFNAKSLKKAVIELEYTEYKDEIAICQLFSEVSHVEYLSGNYIFIQDIAPQEYKAFLAQLDEVETRTILTRHLKKVEFREFNGEKETLAIARFLLEHGTALEELVFSWSNKHKYCKQSMRTMNEASKFYKASLTVKVITLLRDQ